MIGSGGGTRAATVDLEALTVSYVALPSVLFLGSWIFAPLGPLAAAALFVLVAWVVSGKRGERPVIPVRCWALAVGVAFGWCLLDGQGHFVYANSDWRVRDAVLLDLVEKPWPVIYRVDGSDFLLRAPIGYYLPAAIVGKAFGLRVAELCLAAYTWLGVSIVFVWLLRDSPTLRASLVRLLVFVLFSGMDILPTLARDNFNGPGDMIEWWARYLMYASNTTSLFWAPNHTLPGWMATAWLVAQDPRTISLRLGVLLVVLMPIAAPLTALGVLPLVVVAIVRKAWLARTLQPLAEALDPRVLAVALIVLALEVPYLLSGTGAIPAGLLSRLPFVGDDATRRYVEFAFFEFLLLALLLLKRAPRDPMVAISLIVLLTLPFFYFGPYNDLSMRTSIAALTVFAIVIGRWLSSPLRPPGDAGSRVLVVALLAVGAVTPAMEFIRVLSNPAWPLAVGSSLVEATTMRGTHYLAPADRPWLDRFVVAAAR